MSETILGGIKNWRNSLAAKVFAVCFVAVHIPLLALIGYLMFAPSEPVAVIIVTLIATFVGASISFISIRNLLHPLRILIKALSDYRQGARVQIPKVRTNDEVGAVTKELASLIAHLETTLKRLREQALTDPLTGLGNRRWLMDAAAAEATRARREGEQFAVVLFDLDRFKRINDEFGHDVGDAVLIALAETAKSCLRPYDFIARIGGEEFCMVLPRATQNVASTIAERVRSALETLEVSPLSRGAVTASFGVCAATSGCDTLKAMIVAADRCLYSAKNAGRNRVSVTPWCSIRTTARIGEVEASDG